jgi:hypothetical protein
MVGNDIDISDDGAPDQCVLCTYWRDNYANQMPDVTVVYVHYAEGAPLPCADRFFPHNPSDPQRFAMGIGGCECAQAQGSDACAAPGGDED